MVLRAVLSPVPWACAGALQREGCPPGNREDTMGTWAPGRVPVHVSGRATPLEPGGRHGDKGAKVSWRQAGVSKVVGLFSFPNFVFFFNFNFLMFIYF